MVEVDGMGTRGEGNLNVIVYACYNSYVCEKRIHTHKLTHTAKDKDVDYWKI